MPFKLFHNHFHNSGSGSFGMNAGLEAALTEKQETEAKLLQAQQRIQQLEETIRYNFFDFY